ncbi:serine/threonine-protein kinase [Funiculus sociatus GB2-A5]|uniref:Serine/threonine-protein kinase n=1 Tax=Funiculus sociatus GB2-A5 TaxID=2933946 RepID=A0ABV0JNY9_9CYAN|nr:MULTISPECIES: serine/threonine-protein kinase [unclassified Trichocoleus]MBD1908219.1 GUN4 domain-containing protein [Trichocoleus sp. FACHB-832]MBD2061771.1 GUN4 domain-containing protein [Trichocoleus sp. FACHB-6]
MFWTTGQQLDNGKYVIDSVLGQGGFGVTYRARHGRLNDLTFVIKTPNPFLRKDREYARYVERFIKEAQLLAKLCANPHPHIVRVSDFFYEGDMPCLVMEYIAGENLSDLVERKGALPETEAVEYIRQVGDALVFIHQRKLVHRDTHPGNIMLRPGRDADLSRLSQAILIDFGLAGEILPKSPTSRHFANKDFAPYEQMMGSVAPTVDVYCLAASLYYAVTREYPAAAWDRRYHSADLVAPQQHNPRISKDLNQAILSGMALEPENRPQSMGEWLQMLVPEVTGDDRSSEQGIDYNKLRELLASGNWKQADQETADRMLEAIGKERWWDVTSNDISEFPCADLRTIDTLWVKYSNGRFGFSVQKRIWESVTGKPGEGVVVKPGEWDLKIYKKFGDRVGWYVKQKDEWLSNSNLTFTLNAAEGHLPALVWLHPFYPLHPLWINGREISNWVLLSSLVSRLVKCSIA